MSLEVRVAKPADADALVRLIVAHARYEKSPVTQPGLSERLRDALAGDNPRLKAFVAEANNALVAYSTASVEFSTWVGCDYLHMDCLFVDASMRGKSIGRQLFFAVERYAQTCGIRQIQWQTPDWNNAAQRFYNSLGATASVKFRYAYSVRLASDSHTTPFCPPTSTD